MLVLTIGLGLGGIISWYSIQNNNGFGALNIGQWTAWPAAGSTSADSYTKAKVAAEGEVPLGAAEGLAFNAMIDSDGNELLLNCRYLIEGQTPPARLWTLSAHLLNGQTVQDENNKAVKTISQSILREPNGKFLIQTGPKLVSGNWLKTSGKEAFQLVFRLYDSPITSTSGIVDPEMPTLKLLECNP